MFKEILKDNLLWFLWFPFRNFIQCLPIRLVNTIGQIGGLVLYLFARREKKIMSEEISFLFSKASPLNQKEISRTVYRGLQIFSKRQMENLCWEKMTPQLIGRMVSLQGITHLEKALQKGNGVILLTAHFGSHLLLPLALSFTGYKINQIAGPPLTKNQRAIYHRIFKLRSKKSGILPIRFMVLGQSMRPVFKTLGNNEIVVIAFDGREGNKWIPVDFFSHKALFAPGPFKLALKTKASIIPAFIIRQKDDTHRLIIEPPFEVELTEDEEKTLALNTARFAGKFEGYVSRYPCHYAMTLMRMRELIQEDALNLKFHQELFQRKEEISREA